ncbi:MAG: LacI family DNA-binding transcriptional regulator [Clostridia bacterium]|jgi:DNA-binding LacI/PurR family transcriptional regulator/ABC-type glycerol-3-phosphate transport system substrate-binding protein|nr:LacI family DNA-binding transcriptional regulator [Clostridia bacterium]
MATLKDVAKLAGVSNGTVSNVLNGNNNVKLETVNKVEQAIKELGYRPDIKARSLKTKTTMSIGVIMPNINDQHLSGIYQGIEKVLSEKDYTVSLHFTMDAKANEERAITRVLQQRVDGIILMSCMKNYNKIIEKIDSSESEIVFIEREPEDYEVNFVGSNNYELISNYIERAVESNITKIAIMTGPSEYSSEKQCIEAYRDTLSKLAVNSSANYIQESNLNKEGAFKATVRLLQLGEIPELIITSSTQLMEGVIKALSFFENEYIQMPKVATLSEDSWVNHTYQNVELIPMKSILIGKRAAMLLIDNMNSPRLFEKKRIYIENEIKPLEKNKKLEGLYHLKSKTKSLKAIMLKSSSSYATVSLLTDFRQKTGIHLEIDFYDYNELYEKIIEDRVVGNYDIIQYDIPWLQEFAVNGQLDCIDHYIEKYPETINDLIPGIFNLYSKYDGHFYGMPYMYGVQLLYYRKDLFEDAKIKRMFYEIYGIELKVPENWVEYNAIAKFFTKKYNKDSPVEYGTTLGGSYSSGALCEFLPRQWGFEGESFDHNNQAALMSKENIRALKNYCESFNYAPEGATEAWWDEQVECFAAGKSAMMILFNSQATDIIDPSKSKIVGKIGYEFVPGRRPLIGGWSLGINKKSLNKQEAFKFIAWASDCDLAIPYTILGGTTPCVNLYKSSELSRLYPWLNKALKSFDKSRKRIMPKAKSGNVLSERKYEEILGEAIYNSITLKVEPEEALSIAQNKLQFLIENS